MSKDPMLRGQAAPAGFASSVSGWIQTHIAGQRLENPSANMSVTGRLNALEGCASFAVAVGDDDPRIRTLSLASPGARWVPGPNQVACVQGAGHKPGSISGVSGELDDRLSGDKLLNALALAALLDLQTAYKREIGQLHRSPEALPAQDAALQAERERADANARRLEAGKVEKETILASLAQEREHRRHLETILLQSGRSVPGEADSVLHRVTGTSAPVIAGDKPGRTPAGVRKRKDRYEALLYRTESINGKQQGVGTFPTVEEAAAAREEALRQVAANRQRGTAPEVSSAQPPDYDPNAEEIAAMDEAATR